MTKAEHKFQQFDKIIAPTGKIKYLAARLKHAHQYRSSDLESQAAMVAFPEQKAKLKKELNQAQHLGTTPDGKEIILFDHHLNSSVIKELGRLREITFRAVGEGTGKLRDIDRYDQTYRHIILWDKENSEIVGAYRIGEAFKLASSGQYQNLYTNELFEFNQEFDSLLPNAIELGRSFIQPQYWTKRGLDYLWQGIGAYLLAHPQVRYLFGAVSISNDYPDLAKQQIVGLYHHFFKPNNATDFAKAKLPYLSDRGVRESYRGKSLKQASADLKSQLKKQRVVLPTLYKHYSDLCDEGGVRFIDFNVDPNFSFCIDGLIVVDLKFIKDAKKKRYLTPNP